MIFHKMIEICLKDDNMHIFVMINALICINHYVITYINSMLSLTHWRKCVRVTQQRKVLSQRGQREGGMINGGRECGSQKRDMLGQRRERDEEMFSKVT